MATMSREKTRLTNATDLRTALLELFRKRLKGRFSARAAYSLCEL